MRITLGQLKRLIRESINEIVRTDSLVGGNVDYNKFVDWAKGEADKTMPNVRLEKHADLEFQWSEGNDDVKVIVYREGFPIGYVSISTFQDGHKINTLGLKPSARGGGVAIKVYDYIIGKTKLYSDTHQTPEARKLWMRLFDRHNMKGYHIPSGKTFELEKNGNELKSINSEFELYTDHEIEDTCLVILR